MNETRIKKLEEKYWKGETSLEEEQELKRIAAENPDRLSPYLSELLASVKKEADDLAVSLDASFDREFWSSLETKDAKVIGLRFRKHDFIRIAAAAVVVVAMGLGLWYGLEEQPTEMAQTTKDDTYENPELAFKEAQKALAFASEKLSRGAEPVSKIKKFHQATLSVAGAAKIPNDTTRSHD